MGSIKRKVEGEKKANHRAEWVVGSRFNNGSQDERQNNVTAYLHSLPVFLSPLVFSSLITYMTN